MTETIATPIVDLIEHLSPGTVPGDILEAARKMERALAIVTRPSGSVPDQRERWRLKKARQRARKGDMSPGTKPDPFILKSLSIQKKVSKKRVDVPLSPGTLPDDWPVDFVEQFWMAFPPYRRQAKAKVGTKLQRIRADGKVTWATLYGGVVKFARTNPGEFAPAPMVWLNDGRWDREYGGLGNGKTQSTLGGFSGLGSRLRQAVAEDRLDLGQPAAGFESAHRR